MLLEHLKTPAPRIYYSLFHFRVNPSLKGLQHYSKDKLLNASLQYMCVSLTAKLDGCSGMLRITFPWNKEFKPAVTVFTGVRLTV